MSRLAAALLRLAGVALALAGIVLLLLCLCSFSGTISQLPGVEHLLALESAHLPQVAAWHTLTTPLGGVLHLDYLGLSLALVCLEWPLSRAADAVRTHR
ncbi:MAG: hypothetical protein SOV74_07195 [Coriobacteriales bacterium]|nr:hypothetical protein [Coriobacteriales bacterium]